MRAAAAALGGTLLLGSLAHSWDSSLSSCERCSLEQGKSKSCDT